MGENEKRSEQNVDASPDIERSYAPSDVELDEEITLFDVLVAVDVNLRHVRRDLGAHLRDVRVDKGVVRRLELPRVQPV